MSSLLKRLGPSVGSGLVDACSNWLKHSTDQDVILTLHSCFCFNAFSLIKFDSKTIEYKLFSCISIYSCVCVCCRLFISRRLLDGCSASSSGQGAWSRRRRCRWYKPLKEREISPRGGASQTDSCREIMHLRIKDTLHAQY